MDLQGIIHALTNQKDESTFKEAWRTFFFNVEQVQKLSADMTSNLALPLLNAGTCWQGGGWNSSSASKKLYELVGVPILSSDFSVYMGRLSLQPGIVLGGRNPRSESP